MKLARNRSGLQTSRVDAACGLRLPGHRVLKKRRRSEAGAGLASKAGWDCVGGSLAVVASAEKMIILVRQKRRFPAGP